MFISGLLSIYFDFQKPNDFSNSSSRTLIENILILLVFAPILEEFTFRGGLTFKRHYFSFSLSLILPHIVAGFFLSFCRIKYGLVISILMHSLVNLPFAIAILHA